MKVKHLLKVLDKFAKIEFNVGSKTVCYNRFKTRIPDKFRDLEVINVSYYLDYYRNAATGDREVILSLELKDNTNLPTLEIEEVMDSLYIKTHGSVMDEF